MPRLIFTPWKELSELLSVRGYFYPSPSCDGPDMRAHACALVEVWKLRGGLPHAVESTSLLTDAILHDDASKNSIFSIRATYSAAFCRFVTVLVDSKIQGKKRTMFQRATDLGLPASFVELRHEATHRELPSLVVLRGAAQRSLEWLWEYYWVKIADYPTEDSWSIGNYTLKDDKELRDGVKQTLRRFAEDEDTGTKRSTRQTKTDHKKSLNLAQELSSVCRKDHQGITSISQILLEDHFLIPENNVSENDMNLAFTTWDTALKELSRQQPEFLTLLIDELASALLKPREVGLNADPYGEAVFRWLDHILTSESWADLCGRYFSAEYVKALCKEDRGHWEGRLRSLVEKRSNHIYLELLAGSGDKEAMAQAQELRPGIDVMDSDGSNLEALREFGWDLQAS